MNNFKKITIFASFLYAFSLNAQAEITPEASKEDSRIRYQSYNANNVTNIKASYGYVTSIVFSHEENILDVTSGFAEGWNITKSSGSSNILYIKPLPLNNNNNFVLPNAKDWQTNIIVTTDKRIYVFEAIYIEPEKKEMFYTVNFRYPDDIKRQKQLEAKNKKLAQEKERLENQEKQDQLILASAIGTPSTPRNWNFAAKVNSNSQSILPDFAYDDGANTYLGFARSKSIPSAFIVENGEEMLTSVSMQRNNNKFTVMVIHGVNPVIYLRSGQKLVGIFNKGYAQQEYPYETTTIDQVERVLKK